MTTYLLSDSREHGPKTNFPLIVGSVALVSLIGGVVAGYATQPISLYAPAASTVRSNVQTAMVQNGRIGLVSRPMTAVGSFAPEQQGSETVMQPTVNVDATLRTSSIAALIGIVMGAGAIIFSQRNKRTNRTDVLSTAMFAASSTKSKSQIATDYVLQMPGIISPTGFFDPAGLSRMKTPEQLKYAREAELKHGRVAMLAALGFPFAEEFHPLFPEDSVPSDFSFQLTPLQTYWPLVVLGVGLLETFSIRTFKELNDGTWELRDDHESGDLGFDPLGLKPKDAETYLGIQNRELSNGRLAMIGIAGMVAQELAVRLDVLQADEKDLQTLEVVANTDLKALETLAGITQSIAMF